MARKLSCRRVCRHSTTSTARTARFAAGALHKILIYSVDHTDGPNALTLRIKGDPADAQLLADMEEHVVPVALTWSPTVAVRIDLSLCSVVAQVRDTSPVCDLLTK